VFSDPSGVPQVRLKGYWTQYLEIDKYDKETESFKNSQRIY